LSQHSKLPECPFALYCRRSAAASLIMSAFPDDHSARPITAALPGTLLPFSEVDQIRPHSCRQGPTAHHPASCTPESDPPRLLKNLLEIDLVLCGEPSPQRCRLVIALRLRPHVPSYLTNSIPWPPTCTAPPLICPNNFSAYNVQHFSRVAPQCGHKSTKHKPVPCYLASPATYSGPTLSKPGQTGGTQRKVHNTH
jgi:hypothetical protein